MEDFGPFTLRELTARAEGKLLAAWDHTAALISCIIGLFSKKVPSLEELNPIRRTPRAASASTTAPAAVTAGTPARVSIREANDRSNAGPWLRVAEVQP